MRQAENVTCVYCLSCKPFIFVHGTYQCHDCGSRIEPCENGVWEEETTVKEEELDDQAGIALLAS